MKNRELQALLAKYPDNLEIEIYDKRRDAFYCVDTVIKDTVFVLHNGAEDRVQIKIIDA